MPMRILNVKADPQATKCPQSEEMHRYEVVQAASFDDALGLLRTAWFDVLMIDDGRLQKHCSLSLVLAPSNRNCRCLSCLGN